MIEPDSLILGDCLDVMKDIPDGSIDMVLCDLPYGTTKCKWDVVLPMDKLWTEYKRVTKGNAPVLLFGTEPFSSTLRMSNIKDYRYDWYWHKTTCSNFLCSKKQPLFRMETVSMFYSKSPTYNPQKVKGEPYHKASCKQFGYQQTYTAKIRSEINSDGWRYPDNLIETHNSNKHEFHPTQKPLALCEYLIKTYTNPSDTVLDNCMGSGTTCLAAKNTGRHYIGIEKDEKYYNIAKERIEKALPLSPITENQKDSD